MRPSDINFKPFSQSQLQNLNISDINYLHSRPEKNSSGAVIEIEMTTMSSIDKSDSASSSNLGRSEFELGDAKQALGEIINKFEMDIINSKDTDKEIAVQREHLHLLKLRAYEQLPKLMGGLKALYGKRSDFDDTFKNILKSFIAAGIERPQELRALDKQRESNPGWFSSNKSIEVTLYVDRHCKTLDNLEKEINLFKSLSINILHLMPTIYKLPSGDNDGGYAISDFRTVNPEIGTMDQLRDVFSSMRKQGISPALDMTLNHTADDHPWAEAAKAGDIEKQGYYFLMSEAEKDEYELNLGDVFPDIRKGSFTWNKDTNKFVWTTFKSSQWDLNYANPKVLTAMANEIMFLANQGAEVMRLDAVPHIWKEKGTNCLYQDNIQPILSVFNAMSKIFAPALIFKSEAISEPAKIKPYVSPDLCQLGYNPMLAFHLWDSLCHQDTSLLAAALTKHMEKPDGRVWVNYTRCHDEFAAHFDSELAKEHGINKPQRRALLTDFYTGKDPKSFSKGNQFQSNPQSGTVSATQASMAGVEQALENKDPQQIEAAIKRIKLLNSVVMSVPGIPLINFTGSDDRGQTNDYSYLNDIDKKSDSRWTHRPLRDMDYKQMDPLDVQVMDRIFTNLTDLSRTRAEEMPAFGVGPMKVITTGKKSVLGFIRENDQQKVMVLANFSDEPQRIDSKYTNRHNMKTASDKLGEKNNQILDLDDGVELSPYQSVWLVPEKM